MGRGSAVSADGGRGSKAVADGKGGDMDNSGKEEGKFSFLFFKKTDMGQQIRFDDPN